MRTWLGALAVAVVFGGCAHLPFPSTPNTFTACATPLPLLGYTQHGGPLHVKRAFYLGHTGEVLVVEEAALDNALEFIVGPVSIMNAGFEFQRYQSSSLDRYHDSIQGIGRSGEPVHLVVRSLHEGFLTAYSRDPALIHSFTSCLNEGTPMPLPSPTTRAPAVFGQAVQSDWSGRTFWLHRIAASKYIERF